MAEPDTGTDPALVAAIATQLEDASTDEAAAIASAITAHLSDRERAAAAAAAASDEGLSWEGRRWVFAGRMARNRRPADRIPMDAPDDAWSAAGRADRY